MADSVAQSFKQLHKPSQPLILPNIWDLPSLYALLSLNQTDPSQPVKAIATASFAIAASLGIRDEDLSFEQNLDAIIRLAPAVRAAGLPLTVDIQDGYGERIDEIVKRVVEAGAVGANIEDSIPAAQFANAEGSLYGLEEQARRLKRALAAAREAGCPDFVINARCDLFRLVPAFDYDDGEATNEAILRGKAYLDAGATTVFIWGGQRGLKDSELQRLVDELDGRVAVKLGSKPGALTTKDLANMGVARISVGPSLYLKAMEAVKHWAANVLGGGGLVE